MTWRLKEDRWPNGRPFWTIENPKTREVRVSRTGGVSKYWDHAQAFTEMTRLNEEEAAKPKRPPILTGDEDDFEVVE